MSKRIDQAEIPDMIEQILPIWQTTIERLAEKTKDNTISKSEVELSLKLAERLTSTYALYRIMKAETEREMRMLNGAALNAYLLPKAKDPT